MLLGMFTIAALIGLIPAAVASGKGRSFLAWWLYGFALFIVALPHALMLRADQREIDRRAMSTGSARQCPHCAEVIRAEARVCRYCGRDVVTSRGMPA